MKKVFIFILLINCFSYGQNRCDVLSSKQLNSIKNNSDYKSLQQLGFHYFKAYQNEKTSSEKQNHLLKATEYLQKAYNIGKNSDIKRPNLSKVTCYYGLAYLENKNYKKAFQYINESAKQEYLPAMFYLGRLYSLGSGTIIDNKKAELYYKKVASQSNPLQALACDRLGRFYHNTLKDDKSAATWLSKAVNLGYTRATYLLLNIDDSYGDKIKKITAMDDATQRTSGVKFNKDGELYENDCSKTRKNLNPKIVSVKKDPLDWPTFYSVRSYIKSSKSKILESFTGKKIVFTSGKSPLYIKGIIQDHPFLKKTYEYVKTTSIDNIFRIKEKGKNSKYSFTRVYIDKAQSTYYVFVIESKHLGAHFFKYSLVQVAKVGQHNVEVYTTKTKSFKSYEYPANNVPWYFTANSIKNHLYYKKD